MQLQTGRVAPRPVELGTPDRAHFPLTSPFGPNGERLRPAAVYLRESERDQGRWSFETQYEKARDVLHRYGYYVAMVRLDSKTGSKVSRSGYQDVARAAEHLLIEAVGVYMMSRWGRRLLERIRIGEEFDKLGVDVIDAQRGVPDKPGMMRVIMAGMDEQFLRDLSQKAVDNMPKAAQAGKHAAADPIGYTRVYPQGVAYDRKVTSCMVEHPVYGPLVRELFRRYDGGASTAELARWLNGSDVPNPKSPDGRWKRDGVARMLRRRVYRQWEDSGYGEIEWGKSKRGDWNRYNGPIIRACGEHPWLVDGATWDRVQKRLDGGIRMRSVKDRTGAAPLLAAVLRCPACGGSMYLEKREGLHGRRQGRYQCAARHRALTECRGTSVTQSVAEDAVLRELARVQRAPWQPQAFDEAVRRDAHEAARRRLRAEIAAGEEELAANWRLYRAMGELSDESLAVFRRENQAIEQRIRACREDLAALPSTTVDAVSARELHEELSRTELADVLAHGDRSVLGEVVTTFVQETRLVERLSVGVRQETVWARAEVQWTPDVQLLLDAGLLVLGPAPEPPTLATKQQRDAERARRYRARKREQLAQ